MSTQANRTVPHLVLACALVLAGAMASIWLPPNPVLLAAILALMRVCWLEDNITNDLYGRGDLPGGYKNTVRMRRRVMIRWFGILPRDPYLAERPAHVVATEMRAEAQIWACVLLGALSTTVAMHATLAAVEVRLCAFAAILWVALRRADCLTRSLGYCASGRALPDTLLLPAGRQWLTNRQDR